MCTVCFGAGSPSFRDLLVRVKAVMRGALDNADLPFMRVVEAVGAPRSAAYSPLFQVMCVLQDASLDQGVLMDGLQQEVLEVPACASNHHICLYAMSHASLVVLCSLD